MSTRRTPPQALYEPRVGEVVRDARHGVNGAYVGPSYTTKGAVELRPVRGGVAWDTPASEIREIVPADELEPITDDWTSRPPEGSEAA